MIFFFYYYWYLYLYFSLSTLSSLFLPFSLYPLWQFSCTKPSVSWTAQSNPKRSVNLPQRILRLVDQVGALIFFAPEISICDFSFLLFRFWSDRNFLPDLMLFKFGFWLVTVNWIGEVCGRLKRCVAVAVGKRFEFDLIRKFEVLWRWRAGRRMKRMSELYGICLNFQKIGGVLTVIAWYAVCFSLSFFCFDFIFIF